MKMKKKRKKFKVKGIISFIVIVLIIVGFVYWYKDKRITNIYVTGNKLLSEQVVIELAQIEDYPYIYKVSGNKIRKRLLTSPFVNDASVKKSFLGKVTILLDEYQVLYKDSVNNQYVLSNGKGINYDEIISGIPSLTNEVKDEVYNKFIKALKKIDSDTMIKISEITYDPNSLDDERFLLYMIDQNYVYITLDKVEVVNTYNEIVPTLEGKKGILYLDSGNHFEIKK